MPQPPKKHKHDNDNPQAQIKPTDRLDFLAAIAMDHRISAKESVALRVAMVMMSHRHNETGLIILRHKTIAAETGCSLSAVCRAIDVLEGYGWFDIVPRYQGGERTANKYVTRWEMAAVGKVYSVENRRLLSSEQTPSQQGTDVYPGESKLNSVSLTHGPQPGEQNPVIPERSASGTTGLSLRDDKGATNTGQHGNNKPAGSYKQTKSEADRLFSELKDMIWKTDSDDPEYDPSERAEDSEPIHWHRLLKSGIAAKRIVLSAEKFQAIMPDNQRPCLAGYLARYANDCIDPGSDFYVSEDDLLVAANDNRQPSGRKVSGID